MNDKDLTTVNRIANTLLMLKSKPSLVLGTQVYKNHAGTLSTRILTRIGLTIYVTDSAWTACENAPFGCVTTVQKDSDPAGYERIFVDFEGTVKAL